VLAADRQRRHERVLLVDRLELAGAELAEVLERAVGGGRQLGLEENGRKKRREDAQAVDRVAEEEDDAPSQKLELGYGVCAAGSEERHVVARRALRERRVPEVGRLILVVEAQDARERVRVALVGLRVGAEELFDGVGRG